VLQDADAAFALGGDGLVRWRDEPIARLVRGARPLASGVGVLASALLDEKDRQRVQERAAAFVERRVRERLAPLVALVEGELPGPARGLAYQLGASLGAVSRREVSTLVDAIGPEDRRKLHGRGVRLGWAHVYMPALLKPAAIEVCAALHAAWTTPPGDPPRAWPQPPAGAVSFPVTSGVPTAHWFACGFVVVGAHAFRIDMLDKVAIEVRALAKAGPLTPPPSVLNWLGAPASALEEILGWCGLVPAGEGRFTLAGRRAAQRTRERAGGTQTSARRTKRGDPAAGKGAPLGTLGDLLRRSQP
jgi:ATP-dependent RNA helicase SUPV3L1/SUV3